ncbi:MAG: Chromosome partition protein Smc [Candidatus Woesearchaeota archaeon]|nr:Chromosome partition protein Smc [Candidatus Woesearchaeota archaeon]
MIGEIGIIILKNLRRLMYSKVSALIVLLGPLLLMLIIGVAFNSSGLFGIKIGVYADQYTNVSNQIIEGITARDFSVAKMDNLENCVDSVKQGSNHLCMVFGNASKGQKKVQFHVDYSKLNLVYTLLNMLSYELQDQNMQISMGLTQDLLNTLKQTSSTIQENSDIISELKTNAQDMGYKVTNIQENVEGIEMGVDLSSVDTQQAKTDLKQTQTEMKSSRNSMINKINKYESELNSVSDDAQSLSESLQKLKKDSDAIENNLTDVYSRMECSSQESLFDDLNSELISKQLQSSSDPSCDLISSTLALMQDRTSEIDNAIEDLDATNQQIDSAKNDLEDAEDEIDSSYDTLEDRTLLMQANLAKLDETIDTAEQDISDINSKKQSLSSELSSIKTVADEGVESIELVESAMSGVASNIDSLTFADPNAIIKPILSEIKPIMKNKKTIDYLFPSMVILVITFISVLLSSTIVMKEKSSKAYFRNFITPIKDVYFVIGTFLTSLFIVLIECLILFIVAKLFFNVNIFSNIHNIIVVILLAASIFICIGMILGNLFNSEETTTLAAISLSCIFFMFSSMIIPIESMKSLVGSFAKASPFVISESALRQQVIFGTGLRSVSTQVIYLALYLVGLLVLAELTRLVSKKEMTKN